MMRPAAKAPTNLRLCIIESPIDERKSGHTTLSAGRVPPTPAGDQPWPKRDLRELLQSTGPVIPDHPSANLSPERECAVALGTRLPFGRHRRCLRPRPALNYRRPSMVLEVFVQLLAEPSESGYRLVVDNEVHLTGFITYRLPDCSASRPLERKWAARRAFVHHMERGARSSPFDCLKNAGQQGSQLCL